MVDIPSSSRSLSTSSEVVGETLVGMPFGPARSFFSLVLFGVELLEDMVVFLIVSVMIEMRGRVVVAIEESWVGHFVYVLLLCWCGLFAVVNDGRDW